MATRPRSLSTPHGPEQSISTTRASPDSLRARACVRVHGRVCVRVQHARVCACSRATCVCVRARSRLAGAGVPRGLSELSELGRSLATEYASDDDGSARADSPQVCRPPCSNLHPSPAAQPAVRHLHGKLSRVPP
eukprot:5642623-Prymnesium_polylepis.1